MLASNNLRFGKKYTNRTITTSRHVITGNRAYVLVPPSTLGRLPIVAELDRAGNRWSLEGLGRADRAEYLTHFPELHSLTHPKGFPFGVEYTLLRGERYTSWYKTADEADRHHDDLVRVGNVNVNRVHNPAA